jgi:cell division septation protein DedD
MGAITMTKNDEENQRDEENSASGAPLDEELTAAATEESDDTEPTADDSLGETAPNTDEADDISSAEAEGDTDDPAESGKDWLVDTGLAAAINPQSDVADAPEDGDSDVADSEETASDLYDDDEEDDEDADDDEEDDSWDEDESEDDDYEDDLAESDDQEDYEEDQQSALADSAPEHTAPPTRAVWPMVVGGIALLLIGVGGWDLFQERAALQDRINELEKSQARTRESEAVDAKTVADLEVENAALKLELDTLYQDYNAAMAQLSNMPDKVEPTGDGDDAQETVAPSDPPTALAAQDGDPNRNEQSEAAAPGNGGWFINIGAYASSQSADTWVLRLQNSGYDVSVTKVQTPEGTTLNRVRLTGFDSKAAAKDVAQELELDYGTGPLWVGELPSAN